VEAAPRLLVEDGGSRLHCPCPTTDDHLAAFDCATGLVECGACELLVGRAAYRRLVEHRLQHQDLADRLAEFEASWDPRDRAARARAARVEVLYIEGLADLPAADAAA
jgi:hypothetical protein